MSIRDDVLPRQSSQLKKSRLPCHPRLRHSQTERTIFPQSDQLLYKGGCTLDVASQILLDNSFVPLEVCRDQLSPRRTALPKRSPADRWCLRRLARGS